MKNYILPIEKLANSFSKLGGVGFKTATRYAYSVIDMNEDTAKEFANNILEVKKNVQLCNICGNFTDVQPCAICAQHKSDIVCVVKEPKDILALQKVKDIEFGFHVLHGVLNPLQNKGPNDIRIKELLTRIKSENIKEVIMATNPDVEGEATALYIAKLLQPLGVKVSRLAQGVSMGSDLEFQDEVTLFKAIENRKILNQ